MNRGRAPLILATLLAACHKAPPVAVSPPDGHAALVAPAAPVDDAGGALSHGEQLFAARLYNTLPRATNLVFSPASARIALGMAFAGARGGTRDEMRGALALDSDDARSLRGFADELRRLSAERAKSGATLRVANRLFLGTMRVEGDFQALLANEFGAPPAQVDFARDPEGARRQINAYVDETTEHTIPTLLPPRSLDSLTRLVLANVVYFKGAWRHPFGKSAPESFFVSPTMTVETGLMTVTDHFRYGKVRGAQVVELPYESGAVSMVVIVPESKFERGQPGDTPLAEDAIAEWIGALREEVTSPACEGDASLPREFDCSKSAKVKLTMPRFRTRSDVPLNAPLAALGMKSAFSRSADFTGIDRTGGVFIGLVVQEAFVDVDEKGTEAAAATAVRMRSAMVAVRHLPEPPPVVVRADHPFLYLIRDAATGSALFVGRMVNPG